MIETEVLIIGSGPSGLSAAWPLLKAGRCVTMIDASSHGELPAPPVAASLDEWRGRSDRWRDILGEDFGWIRADDDRSPKFAMPLGRAVVGTGRRAAPELETCGFVAERAMTAGGLSRIWGAFCATFDDGDLAAPIGASALGQGYRAAAERLGLSGADDELADFYGRGLPLLPPAALNVPAQTLLDGHRRLRRKDDLRLGYARNAVLTEDRNLRKGCVRCGLCLFGCSRGSIYDGSAEIDALRARPGFRYLPSATALKIVSCGSERQAVLVAVGGEEIVVTARRTLLAAGTLNSTALLLDFLKLHGARVRLLSNPVAGMSFVVPRLVGAGLPSHGFALGQLGYRLARPGGDYASGVFYGADTLPADLLARHMPLSRPAALGLGAALAPAMLIATCHLSGDHSDNSLCLENRDGKHVLTLRGATTPAAERMLIDAGRALAKAARARGLWRVPLSMTLSPPGGDAHLAGTVPMGGAGPLACDGECEVSGARGVHIVDGSWLPRLPAKHLTFTLMANAHRVGESVARDMASVPDARTQTEV